MTKSDETVDKITHNSLERPQWTTDHEEAENKMFVVAKHMIDGQIQQLIIASRDTDEISIAIYQFKSDLATLNKLWLKSGTGEKKSYDVMRKTLDRHGRQCLKFFQLFMS